MHRLPEDGGEQEGWWTGRHAGMDSNQSPGVHHQADGMSPDSLVPCATCTHTNARTHCVSYTRWIAWQTWEKSTAVGNMFASQGTRAALHVDGVVFATCPSPGPSSHWISATSQRRRGKAREEIVVRERRVLILSAAVKCLFFVLQLGEMKENRRFLLKYGSAAHMFPLSLVRWDQVCPPLKQGAGCVFTGSVKFPECAAAWNCYTSDFTDHPRAKNTVAAMFLERNERLVPGQQVMLLLQQPAEGCPRLSVNMQHQSCASSVWNSDACCPGNSSVGSFVAGLGQALAISCEYWQLQQKQPLKEDVQICLVSEIGLMEQKGHLGTFTTPLSYLLLL